MWNTKLSMTMRASSSSAHHSHRTRAGTFEDNRLRLTPKVDPGAHLGATNHVAEASWSMVLAAMTIPSGGTAYLHLFRPWTEAHCLKICSIVYAPRHHTIRFASPRAEAPCHTKKKW